MKRVLISGASFAGLSSAFWMRRLGYEVTIVELAKALRTGGTAVNIEGPTIEVARRMGILDAIRANRLSLERWDYKNADDVTEGSMLTRPEGEPPSENDLEVERNTLLALLHGLVSDVECIFGDTVTVLRESKEDIEVTFRDGSKRSFDLVLGCDGMHSTVRKLWFGHEAEYIHFLEQYFSITIVDKSLIRPNTAQMFNVPGKAFTRACTSALLCCEYAPFVL